MQTSSYSEFIGGKYRNTSLIKVIGVGNGGCNIVNNMYKSHQADASFVVCNTDIESLTASPVPNKFFLEKNGIDGRVVTAYEAAEENIDTFRQILNDGTRMLFITAGMGGETGTSVAPVLAKISKELGILTIGVVTTPFFFEGETKITQALNGVKELSRYVDTLILINNEQMRKTQPDVFILETISKADKTLRIVAQNISEIINQHGVINLDFEDLKSTLQNGGVAFFSSGYGDGENRIDKALENAFNTKLHHNIDFFKAKKILLNILGPDNDENCLTMEEMEAFHVFSSRFETMELKWGLSRTKDFNKKVKITVLATGFDLDDVINNSCYNGYLREKSSKDNLIFISYKRPDKGKVFKIKDFIERRIGNKCWIDLDGIESDAQFANVIIRAINQAQVFLFMYSSSHSQIEDYENDWTIREINFAQIKKKRIVFINVDKTPLTDWFKLMFGSKQQVDANSDVAMQKLCNDITNWLKRSESY